MASIAGIGSFIAAIAAMIFIIVRRLVFGDPVAGWASTVVIILFIGGIQQPLFHSFSLLSLVLFHFLLLYLQQISQAFQLKPDRP